MNKSRFNNKSLVFNTALFVMLLALLALPFTAIGIMSPAVSNSAQVAGAATQNEEEVLPQPEVLSQEFVEQKQSTQSFPVTQVPIEELEPIIQTDPIYYDNYFGN